MKLSERLDIAAKIHEDMSGKTALSTTIREAAELVRSVEGAAPHLQVEAGGCAPPVILPLPPWCQQPVEAVARAWDVTWDCTYTYKRISKAFHDYDEAVKYADDIRAAGRTNVILAPLYTTPPPAIDIGKLRELVSEWRSEARDIRDRGMACNYNSIFARADQLAALIGGGGEKWNG